jgi:hypothetical protein
MTSETFADGSSRTYTYDAGNRLTQAANSLMGDVTDSRLAGALLAPPHPAPILASVSEPPRFLAFQPLSPLSPDDRAGH